MHGLAGPSGAPATFKCGIGGLTLGSVTMSNDGLDTCAAGGWQWSASISPTGTPLNTATHEYVVWVYTGDQSLGTPTFPDDFSEAARQTSESYADNVSDIGSDGAGPNETHFRTVVFSVNPIGSDKICANTAIPSQVQQTGAACVV